MNVRDFTGAFLDASSFNQELCWQMRESASVTEMLCATFGAAIRPDCICDQDLYDDKDCINPSRAEEMSCNLPLLIPSGAHSVREAVLLATLVGMMSWFV